MFRAGCLRLRGAFCSLWGGCPVSFRCVQMSVPAYEEVDHHLLACFWVRNSDSNKLTGPNHHPMQIKGPRPWGQAHLDFEPELPDSRESFKSIQGLDFDAVVLVIQHLPHQADIIGCTSRGLEHVRRGGRDRRSGCPGPTVSQVSETSPCRHQPEGQV